MEPGHLLHSALTCPSSANPQHLKSRHPFVLAVQQLINSSDNNNKSVALLADHRWNAEWLDHTRRLRTFIPDIGTHPPGMALQRTACVRLNRLRTGVGRFRYCSHKQVIVPSAAFDVAHKNKPSTMLFSNVQSIDLPCTSRPDGSGWWDNRMAAQHLPQI